MITLIRFSECPIDHYDQIQFQNLFDPTKVLVRAVRENLKKYTYVIETFTNCWAHFITGYGISIPMTAKQILLHSQSSPFIICKHF